MTHNTKHIEHASHKQLMQIYFPCLVNMFDYRRNEIMDLNESFECMTYEGKKWLEFLVCALKVEKTSIIKVSNKESYYNLYFRVTSIKSAHE